MRLPPCKITADKLPKQRNNHPNIHSNIFHALQLPHWLLQLVVVFMNELSAADLIHFADIKCCAELVGGLLPKGMCGFIFDTHRL